MRMKTVILYASVHHKNTEKLVQALAKRFPDTDLIDTTKASLIDLVEYDLIGIASGIYFGKFHKSIPEFLKYNLPSEKNVFLMYTCGSEKKSYAEDITKMVESKRGTVVGTYGCFGYDTFGPFKLVGGLQKGHPTDEEITAAVEFVENLIQA